MVLRVGSESSLLLGIDKTPIHTKSPIPICRNIEPNQPTKTIIPVAFFSPLLKKLPSVRAPAVSFLHPSVFIFILSSVWNFHIFNKLTFIVRLFWNIVVKHLKCLKHLHSTVHAGNPIHFSCILCFFFVFFLQRAVIWSSSNWHRTLRWLDFTEWSVFEQFLLLCYLSFYWAVHCSFYWWCAYFKWKYTSLPKIMVWISAVSFFLSSSDHLWDWL